ncbi:MAG: hypothetical protein AAFZ18_16815 [Myxococcota bacterium]
MVEQTLDKDQIALLQLRLLIEPRSWEAALQLGELLERLGARVEAMAHYALAIGALETTEGGLELAEALGRVLNLDEENVPARIKLAETLGGLERPAEAVAELETAALLLERQGRVEEYIQVVERLLYFDSSKVELAKQLARAYLSQGAYAAALAKLQLCIREAPDDVETLLLVGKAFFELGQVEEAVVVLGEVEDPSAAKEEITEELEELRRSVRSARVDPQSPDGASDGSSRSPPSSSSTPSGSEDSKEKLRALYFEAYLNGKESGSMSLDVPNLIEGAPATSMELVGEDEGNEPSWVDLGPLSSELELILGEAKLSLRNNLVQRALELLERGSGMLGRRSQNEALESAESAGAQWLAADLVQDDDGSRGARRPADALPADALPPDDVPTALPTPAEAHGTEPWSDRLPLENPLFDLPRARPQEGLASASLEGSSVSNPSPQPRLHEASAPLLDLLRSTPAPLFAEPGPASPPRELSSISTELERHAWKPPPAEASTPLFDLLRFTPAPLFAETEPSPPSTTPPARELPTSETVDLDTPGHSTCDIQRTAESFRDAAPSPPPHVEGETPTQAFSFNEGEETLVRDRRRRSPHSQRVLKAMEAALTELGDGGPTASGSESPRSLPRDRWPSSTSSQADKDALRKAAKLAAETRSRTLAKRSEDADFVHRRRTAGLPDVPSPYYLEVFRTFSDRYLYIPAALLRHLGYLWASWSLGLRSLILLLGVSVAISLACLSGYLVGISSTHPTSTRVLPPSNLAADGGDAAVQEGEPSVGSARRTPARSLPARRKAPRGVRKRKAPSPKPSSPGRTNGRSRREPKVRDKT